MKKFSCLRCFKAEFFFLRRMCYEYKILNRPVTGYFVCVCARASAPSLNEPSWRVYFFHFFPSPSRATRQTFHFYIPPLFNKSSNSPRGLTSSLLLAWRCLVYVFLAHVFIILVLTPPWDTKLRLLHNFLDPLPYVVVNVLSPRDRPPALRLLTTWDNRKFTAQPDIVLDSPSFRYHLFNSYVLTKSRKFIWI